MEMTDVLHSTLAKHLRAQFKPALVQQGFRGDVRYLYRDMDEVWEVIDVQFWRQQWREPGDSKVLRFTANLGVASKWILGQKRGFPQRPPARIVRHYENRVGMLMTPPVDRWWSIAEGAPEDELTSVVQDFTDAVVTWGLPGITRYASDARLLKSWYADRRHLSLPEEAWLAVLERKPVAEAPPGTS